MGVHRKWPDDVQDGDFDPELNEQFVFTIAKERRFAFGEFAGKVSTACARAVRLDPYPAN